MKKFCAVLASMALLVSVAVVSPTWAGGGKNRKRQLNHTAEPSNSRK